MLGEGENERRMWKGGIGSKCGELKVKDRDWKWGRLKGESWDLCGG